METDQYRINQSNRNYNNTFIDKSGPIFLIKDPLFLQTKSFEIKVKLILSLKTLLIDSIELPFFYKSKSKMTLNLEKN